MASDYRKKNKQRSPSAYNPALASLADPSPTLPCQIPPSPRQSLARQYLALLCQGIYQPSHTSSRQFGGMIPSASARAIIPRWRMSARKTWQRRQSTRKLLSSLVASFPLRMWSMWHTSSACGLPQCRHVPPSRTQMRARVTAHISRDCLRLGISLPCPARTRRAIPCLAELYRADPKCPCGLVAEYTAILALSYRARPRHAVPSQGIPVPAGPIRARFIQPP